MRYLLTCSLLLMSIFGTSVRAQNLMDSYYLGINLDKTLVANLNSTGYIPNRGFVFEPFLKIKSKRDWLAHFSVGYSSVGFEPSNEILNLENYQSKGIFTKLGIDAFLSAEASWIKISLTSLLTATLFDESWEVFFEGDYFPDYRVQFKRESLVSVGGELGLNFWIPLGRGIYLHQAFSLNAALHTRPNDDTDFPVIYIPGVGSSLSDQGNFRNTGRRSANDNLKFSPTFNLNLVIAIRK